MEDLFGMKTIFSESMAKNKISNPDNLKPFMLDFTTAGTGSETSRAAAIINDETKVKKINFSSENIFNINHS